eukprot:jgi/Chrpa1/2227/Chrysochromulina_OHIO_Genome00017845-RA
MVILEAPMRRAKMVAEKSEPERLSVVGVPSSVAATKPVTTTIGAVLAQSAESRSARPGALNHSPTRSAVISQSGSTPTTLAEPLSPRPKLVCSTTSTSRASSHALGTSSVSRYACIVIADHTSP